MKKQGKEPDIELLERLNKNFKDFMFKLKAFIKQCGLSTCSLFILFMFINMTHGKAQSSIAEGQNAIERYQYVKAKNIFRGLMAQDPQNATYYYYMGNIYWQIGKNDSASYYYEMGIQKNEKEPLNYVGRGKITLTQTDTGKVKRAQDNGFNLALKLGKKNHYVMQQIADAIYENYETKASAYARAAIDRAMTLDKKNIRYIVTSGDIYRLEGESGKGATEYKRALEADPKLSLAAMKLGDAYVKVNNPDEAFKYYNQVITNDPDYAPVYNSLGEFYYSKNDIAKAVESYQKYINLVGNNPSDLVRFGSFLFAAGKYKLAIDNLEKAVAAEPTYYPSAYRILAYSYLKLENYDKVLQNINTLFKLFKDKPQSIISNDYTALGDAYVNLGKDSIGILNYYKAMDMDTAMDYYRSIAELYNKANRPIKAAETWEKRIEYTKKKDRFEAADYYYIGKSYFDAFQYVKADTAFARYNRFIPDQPACLLYRALIHNIIEDSLSTNGAAAPYFQKFIDLAANNPDYKSNIPLAYNYMGKVAFNKKDNDKADEWFKKTLELDPANDEAKQYHDYFEKLKKQKSQPKGAAEKTKPKRK